MPPPAAYFKILRTVDTEFERNRRLHGNRIRCGAGCADCCHQRFHITGLDAERIAEGLREMDAEEREWLEARARNYIEDVALGAENVPCPALEGGICSIYQIRPVICHKFGMPIYDPDRPDRIYACERNFRDGEEIHDPDLIRIQTGIHREWQQVQRDHDTAGPTTIAAAILEAELQIRK